MTRDSYKPAAARDLEREAEDWDQGALTPRNWVDDPDAIPRARQSVSITLRIPTQMLLVLKALAAREGIGYQVLIKR